MPVSFLSESQKQHYGCYVGEPTAAQLAQYFYLDDTDQMHLARRRGLHNRLGFAVQLGTVRFLGTFLPDPTAVPAGVVRYLAQQLRIADPSCLTRYRTSDQRWEHTAEIRRVYGYTDFLTPRVQFRLQRWLYALCWTGTDRPSVLFERAITWLLSHKVMLPGVSVLERLVARLRPRVEARVARVLTRGLSPAQQTQLTTLLHVPPGSRASTFERLRRGPIRQSVPALRAALRRVEEVRTLGLTVPSAGRVPPARLQTLARFAATTRMTALQRLAVPRQLATLLAFLHTLEATAQDDVLDLVDSLLTDLFAEAVSTGQKARLRTLKDLDVAADRLRHACAVLFDATLPEGQVRTAAFAAVPRETLAEAMHQVDRLVRPPDEVYYPELQASYRRVRRFLPPLLRTMTFAASPAGQAVVDALGYLRHVEAPRSQAPLEPPLAVVTPRWRRYVVRADDTVDPQAYTFWVVSL
jgi:hypothetical protein